MSEHEMEPTPVNPPAEPVQVPRAAAADIPLPAPRRLVPVTVPSAAPLALSATPDAMALLRALRRRWLMALALGCLAAMLSAAAAWYLMPPKYIAQVTLLVSASKQFALERQNDRMEHLMVLKTSADRIKNKEIELRALNQEGVRNLRIVKKHGDAITALMWMEENLKVEFKEGSELLNINLGGDDPDDLRALISALTKSFLDTVNREDRKQRQDRLQRYEKLHVEAKEKLRDKVAEKETLLSKKGAKDPHTLVQQQADARWRLRHAEDVLASHQFELDKKDTKLAVMEKHRAEIQNMPAPEIPLKQLLELDADLKLDEAKKVRLENTIDLLRNQYGHPENDGTVVQARGQLDTVKKRIEKRLPELRAEVLANLRKQAEVQVDAHILEIKTEIAPLKAYIAKYVKDVEALAKEAQSIDFWTGRLNIIESEIQQHEKSVAELFQAVAKAQFDVDADPRITQIGEAEAQPRDTKKRLLMLLMVPLAALFGVVLAVGWWEFSARRIQGPDEVSGLSIRVVGAVPELPDPRRIHVGADSQEQEIYRHNLVESIDAIRTMLLRNAPTENLRTVMVTSAVGGEGKTTLASNLAMSLARAGRKTLLIDCDLRRPTAHQLFEQTLQPGFSEVVLREVELADAVRPTTTDPNLYLLPAGHWDREVIQELAKPGLTAIFEKLHQDFDFIIVDSHPVLPATDSLLIGQHVDAVIVSLMRDVSQVHLVHTACQQLSTLGIRVFGAVVNGVPVKVYGKNYQYASQPVAA